MSRRRYRVQAPTEAQKIRPENKGGTVNEQLILKRFLQAIERIANVTFKEIAEDYKTKASEQKPHSWASGYYQGISDGYSLARSIIGILLRMTRDCLEKPLEKEEDNG